MNGSAESAGSNPALPPVTVVVITRGRHRRACRAVGSIVASDYPAERRSVVVVEETDHPEPITGPGVKYVTIPVRSKGYGFARNQALNHVTSDIVVFTDDDCTVARDWLREIVRPLMDDERVAAAAGAVLAPACGPVGQCESILGFPGGGVRYVMQAGGKVVPFKTFSTCNCAIRRQAIDEAGGFREDLRSGGEDDQLAKDIGGRHPMVYNPAARVYHDPRDNLAGVFAWFVRRGRGRWEGALLSARRGWEFRHMVRTSMLLRLLLCAALVVWAGIPGAVAAAGLAAAVYGRIVWRHRWARTFYPSPATLALLPLVRFTMDVAYDVGIIGAMLGRGRPAP